MKTVLFLDGRYGSDYEDNIKNLQERGYKTQLLDELYENPEKLAQIPEIDPDFIFIGTTGMYADERQMLIKKFRELNYVPKAVMFFNDYAAEIYVGIARELKKRGTKFFFAPSTIFKDEPKEISWI